LVRAREGVRFPDQAEPVRAAFVLVASPDEQTRHLRTLSAVAPVVQAPDFQRRWRQAPDAEALRRPVLDAPRRRVRDPQPTVDPGPAETVPEATPEAAHDAAAPARS